MALSNNILPVFLPERAVPYDWESGFGKGMVFTSSGYANANLQIGGDRLDALWVIDVSKVTLTADQTYRLFLVGSNDPAFGAGNVDLLATRDFAATSALRLFANQAPASSIATPAGIAALRHVIPFSNHMGGFMFEYLQLYVQVSGTAPSITFTSWVSYDGKGC